MSYRVIRLQAGKGVQVCITSNLDMAKRMCANIVDSGIRAWVLPVKSHD